MELIKINGNILNSTYFKISRIDDPTVGQDLNSMELTRQHGAKIISTKITSKKIMVKGLIYCGTLIDYETQADNLRNYLTFEEGDIVVNNSGGYRLFTGSLKSLIFLKPGNNFTYAPFEAEYQISDPPFGKQCDDLGRLINTTALDVNGITSEQYSGDVTFAGSAVPKPLSRLTVNIAGSMSSFDFYNTNNGQQISITDTPVNGDVYLIDTENLQIQKNGDNLDFNGVLPEFDIGVNKVVLNVYSSSGTTLDQSQTTNNSSKPFFGTRKIAQSFQLSAAGVVPSLSLLLKKIGSPAGNITVEIQTDSGGSPSGTVVSGGSVSIPASEILSSALWINKSFAAPPSLAVSTTYWLVVYTSGGNIDNYYSWALDSDAGYAGGSAKLYTTSWAALTGDMCFKIYKMVVDQNNSMETGESATESFTSTTNKDAGNTTADWGTDGILENVLILNAADQSQTTGADSIDKWGGSTTDNNKYFAQTFVPGVDSTIEKIDLSLKRTTNGTTGDLFVWIYATQSGLPNGTLLASFGSRACSTLTTSYAWYSFTGSLNLSAGTTYAIVTRRTGNDNAELNSVYWGINNAGGYASGQGSYNNGTGWVAITGQDFAFKTYKSTYADGVGQSNALDSASASIIAATLSKNDTTPASTSIAYRVSSDGANFETVTPDTELYFTNLGSALKFKASLDGINTATPSVQDLTISYKLGVGCFATTTRVAESFVSGFTGNLGRVELNLKKLGSPGAVTVAIYSDSAGIPNTLLATEAVAAANIQSAQFGWVSINFVTPASISVTTTYWIVISAAEVSAGNGYYVRSRAGNTYASGTLKVSTNSGTDYTEYANEDLLFRTFASSGNVFNVDLDITYTKRYL